MKLVNPETGDEYEVGEMRRSLNICAPNEYQFDVTKLPRSRVKFEAVDAYINNRQSTGSWWEYDKKLARLIVEEALLQMEERKNDDQA